MHVVTFHFREKYLEHLVIKVREFKAFGWQNFRDPKCAIKIFCKTKTIFLKNYTGRGGGAEFFIINHMRTQ